MEFNQTEKCLALKLVRRANVNIPANGCSLNEIHMFQHYFARKGVAIVTYGFSEFGTGRQPMFDGTRSVVNIYGRVVHTLRVMFMDNLFRCDCISNS